MRLECMKASVMSKFNDNVSDRVNKLVDSEMYDEALELILSEIDKVNKNHNTIINIEFLANVLPYKSISRSKYMTRKIVDVIVSELNELNEEVSNSY